MLMWSNVEYYIDELLKEQSKKDMVNKLYNDLKDEDHYLIKPLLDECREEDTLERDREREEIYDTGYQDGYREGVADSKEGEE